MLRDVLSAHLAELSLRRAANPSPVDALRADLLHACRRAATLSPGLFSLTAPTGSGKTLSSMAFALEHASLHGLQRVVYALPFTSVTEQNAAVFRQVFQALGDHVVLEHHSAYRVQDDGLHGAEDDNSPAEVRRRLAAENWDAPIVVTTNVQLLESVFASKPSACRKLHRIARSVIILDEAQTLPVHLLRPTLNALQELAESYGASIVLCSATMPAVTLRDDFPIGLRHVREIVPDPVGLARVMRRTRVTQVGYVTDEALADQVAQHQSVLAVVNTRPHAARLYRLVRSAAPDVFHLSALMCPEHRSRRVAEVKQRLSEELACRVVSTQVIEAGVDVDFDVVYRAMAGLDSIVQAAGRCNREGRRDPGDVFLFSTDEPPPPGLRQAIDVAGQLLSDEATKPHDPLELETIEEYFRNYYWTRGDPVPRWDGPIGPDGRRKEGGITDMLKPSRLMFRTASECYKIIDEWSAPVVVPYGEQGAELCRQLLHFCTAPAGQLRGLLRRAQRYTISVAPWLRDRLVETNSCILTDAGIAVLQDSSAYSDEVGLLLAPPNPELLFA